MLGLVQPRLYGPEDPVGFGPLPLGVLQHPLASGVPSTEECGDEHREEQELPKSEGESRTDSHGADSVLSVPLCFWPTIEAIARAEASIISSGIWCPPSNSMSSTLSQSSFKTS